VLQKLLLMARCSKRGRMLSGEKVSSFQRKTVARTGGWWVPVDAGETTVADVNEDGCVRELAGPHGAVLQCGTLRRAQRLAKLRVPGSSSNTQPWGTHAVG
jgi:hypothetical protein